MLLRRTVTIDGVTYPVARLERLLDDLENLALFGTGFDISTGCPHCDRIAAELLTKVIVSYKRLEDDDDQSEPA